MNPTSNAFCATHEITFTPANGTPRATLVALIDGAAYTREEWGSESAADWVRTDDGRWLFQGQATPGGANGDVSVRVLAEYDGADITVEIGRHTVDPAGIASDDEARACEESILEAVREVFPGATVRAVGIGGRTGGVTRDGADITDDVRFAVNEAFDAFMGG